jgi:hypothetical protein
MVHMDDATTPTDSRLSVVHIVLSLVGWGVQVLFGLFALVSGLVAPPVGVAVIFALWLVTAVLSLVYWKRAPWVALACGLGAAGLIITTLMIGDVVFGWTA